MSERSLTLHQAPSSFHTFINTLNAMLPEMDTAPLHTVVGIGATATRNDIGDAIALENPFVIVKEGNAPLTTTTSSLSSFLRAGREVPAPVLIAYAEMMEGVFDADPHLLAWDPSSTSRGFDLRELCAFKHGIAILDTIHDSSGLDSDDAEDHLFVRSALLATFGPSHHSRLAAHSGTEAFQAWAHNQLWDRIDYTNDGIAS